jgi:hypothetical protein
LHDFHWKIANDDGRRRITPVCHDGTVRGATHTGFATFLRTWEKVAHVAVKGLIFHAAWQDKISAIVCTTCTDEPVVAPYCPEHLVQSFRLNHGRPSIVLTEVRGGRAEGVPMRATVAGHRRVTLDNPADDCLAPSADARELLLVEHIFH